MVLLVEYLWLCGVHGSGIHAVLPVGEGGCGADSSGAQVVLSVVFPWLKMVVLAVW